MTLVFLVPIRHPEDCREPEEQARHLHDLFASIANQSSPDWRCVVIADPTQSLPELPDRFSVASIALPPNAAQLAAARNREEFYGTIRRDKGLRLRRGLAEVSSEEMMMVVDDDDLIHRDLAGFLSERRRAGEQGGWFVERGYSWASGDQHFRKLDGFHRICGTSLLCPPQYFDAWQDGGPDGREAATDELGSHKIVFDKIGRGDGGFRPVPFRAAVYRLGHSNASQADLRRLWRRMPLQRAGALLTGRGVRRAARLLSRRGPASREDRVALTPDLQGTFFGET
jgi:hypothetical protein